MRKAIFMTVLLAAASCGPRDPFGGDDGGLGQVDGADDGPGQVDGVDGGWRGDVRALCVNDPLTSDRGHFDPILDPSAWRFDAAGYSQPIPAGAHETLVIGSITDYALVAATVTPTVAGSDSDLGLAGVVLWATRAPAPVDGYFCGLDLRGQRLVLGRLSGDALAPTITVLGWVKPVAVAVGASRDVWMEVRGADFVSCYADGGLSDAGVPRADSMTSSDGLAMPGGTVGLMTFGIGASFRDASWCRP